MIELIISVCLIGQAERCKDVHLTYTAQSVTPMQCMMSGQPQIAQWINFHPKWAVKRWKCGRVTTTAQNDI
jgi:hypothetical protein